MARFSVKRSTKTRIRALLAAAVAVLMAMLAVPAPAQAYDPPAVSPFSDVPTSHPHYTEIAWMWEQGISTGWPDGTYRPSQQVDRDAMAAFFYRYQGEPAYTAPPSSPFTDIWPSIMFYKEMSWMEATGISTGWPDGTYRPWDTTLRDAMSAFIYRVAGEPDYTPPATSPFRDITPSTQFYKEMNWMAYMGIANDVDNGVFNAWEPVTREMMAVFMFNLANPSSLKILTASLPGAVVDHNYQVQLYANGGQQPYSWSATGLPDGLEISPSGLVSGTPTAAGPAQVMVTVTDANGDTVNRELPIEVKETPDPLTIETTQLQDATTGVSYTAILTADGGVSPYTWSATGLPAGLQISARDGTITGTPTGSGTSTVRVTVQDSQSPAETATVELRLQVSDRLAISTDSLPTGVAGYSYQATLAAQGGAAPYTWSASNLPAGLSMTAGGQITGTPSASGSRNVTVTVTDNRGVSVNRNLTLTVNQTLQVTTSELPLGVQGEVYSASLSATGGIPPYTWSASGLPSGLSLNSNGTITGTPSQEFDDDFYVTVTDSGGRQASRWVWVEITWENNCDVLRCIAITFDDGPLAYSGTLAEAFADRDATATFFDVGVNVRARPGEVSYKHNLGMAIGMHGWEHLYYTNYGPNYVRYDFNAAAQAIEDATGAWPDMYRPNYGYYNPTIRDIAGDLGMATIMWTDNTFDYEYTNSNWLHLDTVEMASRNSVILMHDGYSATAAAIPYIIDDLQAEGYTLVTVPMLLGYDPEPGVAYFDPDPIYYY